MEYVNRVIKRKAAGVLYTHTERNISNLTRGRIFHRRNNKSARPSFCAV